jgi:hypothetical protein
VEYVRLVESCIDKHAYFEQLLMAYSHTMSLKFAGLNLTRNLQSFFFCCGVLGINEKELLNLASYAFPIMFCCNNSADRLV